jgi:hypothetical protein
MPRGARKWFAYYLDQADGLRRFTSAHEVGLSILSIATMEYYQYVAEIQAMPKDTSMKARWTLVSSRSAAEKTVKELLKEFGLTWKSQGNK